MVYSRDEVVLVLTIFSLIYLGAMRILNTTTMITDTVLSHRFEQPCISKAILDFFYDLLVEIVYSDVNHPPTEWTNSYKMKQVKTKTATARW